ncbi:MAG: hypothetical protein EBS05_09595 [Proteobacteria bacterium]|nr:hypothetical protein [Pseudomonadota bacterium]
MNAKLLLSAAAAVVLAGCCTTVNVPPAPNAVLRVKEVTAHWEREGNGYDLVIIAKGTVPTSGYTSPWLDPVIFVDPPNFQNAPKDRYLTFQFLAVRPGSTTNLHAKLDELVVTNRWKGVLRDVHGVRVIGQENQACKWVGHPPEKR